MAVALTPLDGALYRLLHHRSVRARCRVGRWEVLGLAEPDQAVVMAVDWQQLEQVATAVREELLGRQYRGSGSLRTLYPRTLQAWQDGNPNDPELSELMSRFMESAPYDDYQEVPHSDSAPSLEEAFFHFCAASAIGEKAILEDEFLTAMAQALVVSPRPGFAVPAQFRRVRAGWVAVSAASVPRVYAAVNGRLVVGDISPFLAELIVGTTPPEEIARRHGEDAAALPATLAELSALGLSD